MGRESYEALDIIAQAVDKHQQDEEDWSKDLMALTAVVRIVLDNERFCKFDKMAMDLTTFCFINDCSWFTMMGKFSINWAEAVYSFTMIWTTVVSSQFTDYSLENDYNFYFSIGDNVAMLIDDLIGYRPKDEYTYTIDDDEFAEQ